MSSLQDEMYPFLVCFFFCCFCRLCFLCALLFSLMVMLRVVREGNLQQRAASLSNSTFFRLCMHCYFQTYRAQTTMKISFHSLPINSQPTLLIDNLARKKRKELLFIQWVGAHNLG